MIGNRSFGRNASTSHTCRDVRAVKLNREAMAR